MRELEAKATKDVERNLSRDLVQEEEQLMEEKKRKKDDKKKKEAAQKKATEQKIKVPEQIKPSVSQPQPANSDNGTSTATSTNNNAKRATASNQQPPPPPQQPQQQQQQEQQQQQQQPQALPRYPREVPPRFRHQEHKQLLKRGQHFPVIAANLGSAVKVLNSQSESSAVTNQQPQNNGEVQNSKSQSDINHNTSGSHYENCQRGPVSSPSGCSTSCKNAVNDLLEKEAWPSAPGSDPELASECIDADSASNSESERNITVMASGNTGGEKDGLRNSTGLGPQSKFVVGSSSNNVGHVLIMAPWGKPHGPVLLP